MRNVVKDDAGTPCEKVESIRDSINVSVRNRLVTGYKPMIGGITR
jgi:hypothetical protein